VRNVGLFVGEQGTLASQAQGLGFGVYGLRFGQAQELGLLVANTGLIWRSYRAILLLFCC